jgi:hypothetical protein
MEHPLRNQILSGALQPLLNAIESLSERIVEYNERIEAQAQQSYIILHSLSRKSYASDYLNWRNGIRCERRSQTDRLERRPYNFRGARHTIAKRCSVSW